VRQPALKHELDSIYVVDQRYRTLIGETNTLRGLDSVAALVRKPAAETVGYLFQKMHDVDSTNTQRMVEIITRYGYPGKSLVGTRANEAAYYVIQHSKVIRRYLPLVKKAAETDEIPLRLYATMLDRQLMFDGKAQVYGTQIRIYNVADPTTQKTETIRVVWPIAHPAGVNRRRKNAGFEETVEENAKQLDTIYRVMTLAEVKKL
jgi:hypothetical protein